MMPTGHEWTGAGWRQRPPAWTYLHFVLQLLCTAAVLAIGTVIVWDAFEDRSAHEYAWAAIPGLIAIGLGWFMPKWFYKRSEAESGLFDPSRQVRGWVVAAHAVCIVAFTVAMWLVLEQTRAGTLTASQAYRLFLIGCGVTLLAGVALRLVVRTPPAVKIPSTMPCPFCGRRWWTRNPRCIHCSRDRPAFWYLDQLGIDPDSFPPAVHHRQQSSGGQGGGLFP